MMNYSVEKKNRVAVVGIGLRLPGNSNSPQEFWNNIKNKFDGVVEIPKDRLSENFYNIGYIGNNKGGFIDLNEWLSFDPLFFGIKPIDAETMDPQQRMLLKCTYEALEDAHIKPIDIRGSKTSVFMGCYSLDYKSQLVNDGPLLQQESSYHALANRISHVFDFRGPSMTLDTACSSSINAFSLGFKGIECGDNDLSIVGGVGMIFNNDYYESLTLTGAISPDGRCKSFDASANGFTRAEGCTILVLKNLDKAIADGDTIYSVVESVNSNSDGNYEKENFNSPSSMAQVENIKSALSKGNIDPSDIFYFECHGTGTIAGDKMETKALSMVFKDNHSPDNPLYIGSIKSNFGHTEATSGACGIAKACLMLKYRSLVPNIHFNTPNPNIDFKNWNLSVVTKCQPFPTDKKILIGINSFGMTGSNGCVILSEYISTSSNNDDNICNINNLLIPISSNSKESLNRYQSLIFDKEFIHQVGDKLDFNDFSKYHILSKPTNYTQRSVINSDSNWDSFSNSSTIISGEKEIITNMFNINNNPFVVFVYCGQGPQWNQMGADLYLKHKIFKDTIDSIDLELSKHFGYSIWEKLFNTNDEESIHDPLLAQPSMFLFQCALTELYKQWNVNPNIITGHSFGEITSLYYSGLISLPSACKVVFERARLQHKTIGSGRMLAISLSESDFNSKYKQQYPNIEIACLNSHNSIVITGAESILREIKSKLQHDKVFAAFLGTRASFHSSSQEMIKYELFENISNYLFNINNYNNSNCKPIMFSTTTSNVIKQYSNQLLFDNLRNPVYFEQTLDNINNYIVENNNNISNSIIFIEIAPHPTLSRSIKDYYDRIENNNIKIYNPLNKKTNQTEDQLFKQTISNLYINGFNIDFSCQFSQDQKMDQSYKHKCQYLFPHYQWDNQIYVKESERMHKYRLEGPPVTTLGNLVYENQKFKSYKSIINIGREPFQYLKGHYAAGKNYFPGCGYIDNIIKAYPQSDNMVISRLNFSVPFILKPNVDFELQSNFTQTSKNEYKVDFNFYENGKWNNSALGMVLLSPAFTNQKLDFQSIKSKCNLSTIPKSELYNLITRMSDLTYTDHFARVEEMYIGNDCSLSKIAMKPRISKPCDNDYLFNPAILDSCLHGMFPLIKSPLKILFDRISNMKLHTENIKTLNIGDIDYIYAYSSNLNLDKVDNKASFTLNVLLQDGTLLFEIQHVVCLSLTPIKDIIAKNPQKDLYTLYWQPKEAIIENILLDPVAEPELIDQTHYKQYCTMLFYNQIRKKGPSSLNKSIIMDTSIEQLIDQYLVDPNVKSKYSKLFRLTFQVLQQTPDYMIDDTNESYNENLEQLITIVSKDLNFCDLLKKSTRVIASMLFPNDNMEYEDTQQYLFKDGGIHHAYDNPQMTEIVEWAAQMISNSFKPYLSNRAVVRILELGSGTGAFTSRVLDHLYKLLEENQETNQIQIEFTFSDVSTSFIPAAKSLFSKYSDKINIIYTTIDIESDFLNKQKLKGSYYDFVIMCDVMHVASQVSFPLDEVYKVLSHGGHLLFIEAMKGFIPVDFIFGSFDQWTGYTDTDIRPDHVCMAPNQWKSLLNNKGFTNIDSRPVNNLHFLMYAQKPLIIKNNNGISIVKSNVQQQVIIYANPVYDKYNLISRLESYYQNSSVNIIDNFQEMISSIQDMQENDILFNLSLLQQLDKNNFKDSTMEYIQISQELLKVKSRCKHILLSLNSTMDSKFYLNSSVVGALRYFTRFNDNVLLDFDETTLNDQQFNLFNLINTLSDTKGNYYREYAIRNRKPFIELAGKENGSKFSNSNQNLENDCLYAKFNPDLSLQLYERPKQLEPHQVEIQLKANGINFRDSLIYRGLVSQQFTLFNEDIHFLGFGGDAAGVVTRVGDQVSKCQVGDRVCLLIGSFGSHHIAHEDYVCLIPDKVSFTEAASIPITYVTVYRSLIKLANLFDEFEYNSSTPKSVLIHSATGGIGLSALNILKWKMKQTGMKINIFATVSTKEKENYLEQNYGSMITGIFSSLSTEYVDGIKSKLLELGSTRGGVDAILNTFASDFMHANFSTLAQDGTIVDLSVTHLYNHEFLDFNKFRHNIGYITTDVSLYPPIYQRTALHLMFEAIANKELDLLPIKVYPVGQLNDALTFIGERKHIGKLTIDYDQDIVTPQLIKQNQNKIIKENNDINSNIKCLLITGQQGMVLETLKWILENSNTITDVIILTKSSMKWDIQRTINQHKSKVNFYFKSVDIGNSKEVHQTINQLYNENTKLPPVDSILHFAYLHTESEPLEITYGELSSVHDSKTMGLINLHEISLLCKWNIKHFIISSSVLVFSPTYNQCAYISANMVYDSFSKYRRSLGLECTNLIFGALQGAGYVSRKKSVESSLSHMGILPTNISKIIGTIGLIITNNKDIGTNLIISKFNFETLKKIGEKLIQLDYFMNMFESNNNTIKSQDSIRDKIISTISDLLSISASKLNYSSMKLKDYGVDSLFMVQLKNWIEKEFQKPNIISISQLQNSTIDTIIQIVQKSLKNNDTNNQKEVEKIQVNNNVEKMKDLFIETHDNEFWNNEIKLDNTVRPIESCVLKENYGRVLLTGATGYLGSHLLIDLLKQPKCKYVYCLVRSKSREHALSRIIQTLSKYQLIGLITQNDIENRIIPIVSDLDQPLLGLSHEEFNTLSQSIDVIIHSAATVRFNILYSQTHDVGNLKELLKLVSNNKERLIRFLLVSSISVFSIDNQSDGLDGNNIDKIPFLESINSHIGYGQSKIIQENIMVEAHNRGIPSVIVRPSFIFANPMTMIPNQNDTLQIFFNSCKSLKKCPQFEESDFISTISISSLSESIIRMALLDDHYWINENNTTIPLINLFGEPIMSKDLFESVSTHTSFPLIDFKEWVKHCLESTDPVCQRLGPLIPAVNPLLFKQLLNGVKSSDKDNKQTVTTDMILKLFPHK